MNLINLPNTLTCCNLICGCVAAGCAFYGQYHYAVLMIIIGAVFDFFDGMVARALGISSAIGKELDSLADVVTFGLAPSAILFYLFHQQFIGLPTPANALFWGSLVLGEHAFLVSLKFNAVFLFLFMLLFCMLLICEVPMLALKFKNLSWADNKQRYIFLAGCLPLLLLGTSSLAAIIVWYVVLSIVFPRICHE